MYRSFKETKSFECQLIYFLFFLFKLIKTIDLSNKGNVAKETLHDIWDLCFYGNEETESSQRYLVLLVLHSAAVVQVLRCPHKEVTVSQ